DVVHELLQTDELRSLLAERWGERVLSGGEVDRQAVAGIVFETPEELAWLEGVLFPRVGARLAGWRAEIEAGDSAALGIVGRPTPGRTGRDRDWAAAHAPGQRGSPEGSPPSRALDHRSFTWSGDRRLDRRAGAPGGDDQGDNPAASPRRHHPPAGATEASRSC